MTANVLRGMPTIMSKPKSDKRLQLTLHGDDVALILKIQDTLERKLMMKLSLRSVVKRCLLKEAQAENIKV